MKKICYLLTAQLLSVTLQAQIYIDAFQIQSSETERGMRITTDHTGNVVTTGFFGGTADFDPGAGSSTLTPAGLSDDVYIAKYDSSLNYIWSTQFGTSGSDFPYALAVDGSNNIIIGGDIASNSRDGFVNKYDANGNLLWSIPLGGINKDVVYGVAADAADNVYVTGYFSNVMDFDPGPGNFSLTSNGGRDIFLAKYDAAGNYRWAFNVGGTITTAYEEGGQDLVISGSTIFLTGNFEGTADFNPGGASDTLISNGSLDMFIASYDTAGNYIWAISMGSGNKHDYAYGIDLDASENIYITGGFEEAVDFDPSAGTAILSSASINAQDIFVASYNSTGSFQWAFQVGGNTAVDDHAFDIDVTDDGDIYICGEVWGPADFDPSAATHNLNASNDQIFFARYTDAGSFVWAFDIGSVSGNGSADNGFGVKATTSGSVYVTGDFSGTADFDPGLNTESLASSGGDAFIGVYSASVFAGINQNESDDISIHVFPNPGSGQIKFYNAGFNNHHWNLEITDVTGKTIFNIDNIKNETITLNTDSLTAGIYFCMFKSDDKIYTNKIVIQ